MIEADHVDQRCNGKIEVTLHDKTREDCLADTYVVEYDWCQNWAESIEL